MSNRYDEYSEASAAVIWFWAIGIALVLATIIIVGVTRPMTLGFERKAATHSHQYIEAHRESAVRKMAEYHTIEVELAKYKAAGGDRNVIEGLELQKTALKVEIVTALSKIPKDEHPEGAEMFR